MDGARRQLSRGSVFLTRPGLEFRCQHGDQCPTDVCLSIGFDPGAVSGMEEAWERAGWAARESATPRLAYVDRRMAGAAVNGDQFEIERWALAALTALQADTNEPNVAWTLHRAPRRRRRCYCHLSCHRDGSEFAPEHCRSRTRRRSDQHSAHALLPALRGRVTASVRDAMAARRVHRIARLGAERERELLPLRVREPEPFLPHVPADIWHTCFGVAHVDAPAKCDGKCKTSREVSSSFRCPLRRNR